MNSPTIVGPALEKKCERLVVYCSVDGESEWVPVLPEKVPDWINSGEVLRQLMNGNIAHNEGDPGWYRVEVVDLDDRGEMVLRPPGADLH